MAVDSRLAGIRNHFLGGLPPAPERRVSGGLFTVTERHPGIPSRTARRRRLGAMGHSYDVAISRSNLLTQLRDRGSSQCHLAVLALSEGAALTIERSSRIPEHLSWLSGLGQQLQGEGQAAALVSNDPEIQSLIGSLRLRGGSEILIGTFDSPDAHFSVILGDDGVLLGCLALPTGQPRRC